MDYLIYESPTWAIVLGVLVVSFLANETGFRFALRFDGNESERSRAVSNGLKASILGLVALLMGFSYSSTSTRYYERQRMVLNEANAVGTCYLRAELLDEPQSANIRSHLKHFTTLRLEYFEHGLESGSIEERGAAMDDEMDKLWQEIKAASIAEPEKLRFSQIIPAANDVIDLNTTRAWAVRNHMPSSILYLLAICIVVSAAIMGHSSGQTGKRFLGLWLCLNILITLVLFVILDFDRSRRGMITVDHTPLVELATSMEDQSGE